MPDEMLEEFETVAPVRARPHWFKRFLGMRFLVISIAVHLLLGLFAAVWVVQSYSANRKLTFKGGPPSPNKSTRAIEHQVQMAKKQSTMSAPASKRIVSTGLSKVTLPDMPAMPKTATQPNKMAGAGGASIGSAAGPMGGGASSGGGSLVSMFGLREATGGTLAGSFYDLKQDRNKKPTGMDSDKYHGVVDNFVKAGWNKALLTAYWTAPQKLFTTQIFVPDIEASEGPKAFQVEREVEPRWWVVHYEGKVIPDQSGTFHFVGNGDDILVVRFNGQTVLDGSWGGSSKLATKAGAYDYGWPLHRKTKQVQPAAIFTKGAPVQVEAGKVYPMEVLIGESPGGAAHYVLFIEKEGETYQKDAKGNPILPMFRLANVKAGGKGDYPKYAENGPIWKAERTQTKPVSALDALKKP